MLVENPHALKEFLMLNLSKLCNADPAALTKYVLALLKKNRPENELKAFLLDQLDVFLLKQTPRFVDLLLTALKTKAYIENAQVSPDREVAPNNDSLSPVTSDTNTHKPLCVGKVVDSKSKEGDSTHTHIENTKATPDVCISSREYERRSKTPPPLSPKIRGNALQDSPQVMSVSETSLSLERESNVRDRNIPVTSQTSVPRSNFIKRCENYDKLGYCLKGSLCAFDHGCDPILVEDVCSLSLNHNFTVCSEESPFMSEVKPDRPKSPLPPLPTTLPPPLPPLPPMYPPPPEPYNPECPAITPYYPPFGMPTLQSVPQRIKTQRTRELIGVPTHNTVPPKEKRKPFDFSRLGPPPKKLANDSSVLEIRKIPSNLNTISMLNRHFSEFGRIVNIEVAYEGDPEGALIKFASPMEATAAFRSSAAIFNNRFIKVFYHGRHKNFPHTQNLKQSETTRESGSNFVGLEKKSSERDSAGNLEGSAQRGEIYTPTHKTPTERVFQKSPLFSPENHLREVKKESNPKVEKQLDLLRKKQDFLNSSINQQKIILAKLMNCKKKKEKEFLKQTIDQISSKISTLKSEIEKDADGLKKQLSMGKISKSFVTKSEKELLDAEMDFYKEKKTKVTHKSKETAKLLSQVNELKEKAKSLGFFEGSLRAPSSNASATHALALSKMKKPSAHGVSRPKRQVLVCSTKDDEELLKHFEQFGPVEDIQEKNVNGYKLVTFSSRSAAEAALSHKIDDIHLVWFQDSQLSIENMDPSADNSESKPINSEVLGDDEEEEDDEDSEARSWRR